MSLCSMCMWRMYLGPFVFNGDLKVAIRVLLALQVCQSILDMNLEPSRVLSNLIFKMVSV